MKLLFLIGDTAVGKMTVGQALVNITDLRLFYNHMAIEPVMEIFGQFNPKAIAAVREVIFEEFAQSANYGMIFTYMWAFDEPSDWAYVEHIKDIFRQKNKDTEFYYAELIAPQEIRLKRNATENRLKHKASKRDIQASNQRLIEDDKRHRCVSLDGEIPFENYIKIDTSALSAQETAERIKAHFSL